MNDALYNCILKIEENINALVSEWSKEVDLRPTVFARMGSNPIQCKASFLLFGGKIGIFNKICIFLGQKSVRVVSKFGPIS